jgi:hypothetical protein
MCKDPGRQWPRDSWEEIHYLAAWEVIEVFVRQFCVQRCPNAFDRLGH